MERDGSGHLDSRKSLKLKFTSVSLEFIKINYHSWLDYDVRARLEEEATW